MSHRVIITAAGDGKRWGNHTGRPKHLVAIPGTPFPLLHETVNSIRWLDPAVDVWVTGPADERYEVPGARLYVPTWNPERYRECAMYVNAAQLWNEDGRTTFLYGDTYYTPNALRTILAPLPDWRGMNADWWMFARFKKSELTGKPWAEVWAHSFTDHRIEEGLILDTVADDGAPRATIWEMYKRFTGQAVRPFSYHQENRGTVTEIDDWTEDFDFPYDYDRWRARRTWPRL